MKHRDGITAGWSVKRGRTSAPSHVNVKDTFWVHLGDDIITTEKHRSSQWREFLPRWTPCRRKKMRCRPDTPDLAGGAASESSRSPPRSRPGFKQALIYGSVRSPLTDGNTSLKPVTMSGNVPVWGGH